jgi:hypothetical protein
MIALHRSCPTCKGNGTVPPPNDIESITELARAVGISKSHASRLFSDDPAIREGAGCSLQLAHAISQHLGMTIEEICSFLGVTEGRSTRRRDHARVR